MNIIRKRGFTLAEVMIVVVIIGVVAVFTMPVLLSEVSERVNSNRQANIAQKITKAVELMIVNGDYEGFQTTDEFVDKLQKYLKTVKRCSSGNLVQCWPSSTVTTSDGSKFNVATATTGRLLHTNNDTNNVGLVLADGASIILTYNPEAQMPSAESGFKASKKDLPIGGGKTKEFSYTSNATNAIDFVMDVNGSTGPNAETDEEGNYYDIRSFKIASFSRAGCPGFNVDGICVYMLGKEYNSLNCTNGKNTEYCGTITNQPISYHAGANKACRDLGLQLPSESVLTALLQKDNSKLPKTGGFMYNKLTSGEQYWKVYRSNETASWSKTYVQVYNQIDVICLGY